MANSLMPCWKRHCDIGTLEARRVTDGIKTSCCGIVLSINLHDCFSFVFFPQQVSFKFRFEMENKIKINLPVCLEQQKPVLFFALF